MEPARECTVAVARARVRFGGDCTGREGGPAGGPEVNAEGGPSATIQGSCVYCSHADVQRARVLRCDLAANCLHGGYSTSMPCARGALAACMPLEATKNSSSVSSDIDSARNNAALVTGKDWKAQFE